MEQETYLAHTIDQTSDHPAYDAACKKVLADKQILAWILRTRARQSPANPADPQHRSPE